MNIKRNDEESNINEERVPIILENGGQKIFGIFHKPLVREKCPAVLICHGFGGQKVGKYRLYVNLAQRLARVGIASLRFDFRGCGDSEGEFSEMTLEGEVSDALQGLNFLKQNEAVDIDRIGILGRSLGGAVAVIAASYYKDIKSICLWSPLFNGEQWKEKWAVLHKNDLSLLKHEDLITLNGQIPGGEFLKQIFSLQMESYLKEIQSKPLFLIHGCQDHVVKPLHSEKYVKSRLEAEGETKFIQLAQSDHDFTPLDERVYAIEETSKWFSHTL